MSICTYCKSEGAYVGHLFVECPNEKCEKYSAFQASQIAKGTYSKTSDEELSKIIEFEYNSVTKRGIW